MAAPTLTTTGYVEVGVYIGQFYVPGAGTLPNNRRIPLIVAKGDRLFSVNNTPLLRSFRYAEPLTFSTLSPHIATLDYYSNGAQASPTALYTSEGQPIASNKWQFIKDVNGNYSSIQIIDTAYSNTSQYLLDYQTTSRTITDVIPTVSIGSLNNITAQIRQITAIGPYQSQDDYVEYQDYFIDFEVEAPVANPGNAALTASFTGVTGPLNSVPGTGSVTVSTSANYLHPYNRLYTLTCSAASGTAPNRLATLQWSSTPVSAGNNALPPTPINSVLPSPVITLDESNALSLSNILLELGVVLDFSFGSSNFNTGDIFYLQANGPGLIELDPLLVNTNQFTTFSAVNPTVGGSSTGTLQISSLPSAYSYTSYNTSFKAEVVSISGSTGSRTVTFVWCMYGGASAAGSFTVSELVPSSNVQVLGATGITLTLSFGASNFVALDSFSWSVLAPRTFYKGKETIRNVALSIGTRTLLPNEATYTGGYLSDTQEGGFGTWTADTSHNYGNFVIPDGLSFYLRNGYVSSLVTNPGTFLNNSPGDEWNMQALSLGTIDFSLEAQLTETFSNPGEIATDTTGAITGVVGASYVVLSYSPDSIISFSLVSNGNPVSYVQVPGTMFLRITQSGFSTSAGDVQVTYLWSGAEPDPGQTYYISGYYLRPVEMYNTPFLFLTPNDTSTFLAPSTVRNDAYIGANIAWSQSLAGLFVIQVQDSDDDGIYSKSDYATAIAHYLDDPRATDLVVLNSFQNIGDQLNIINQANQPFQRQESLTYIGCPIGTPIGSEDDLNSLVFYSARTFQVYGQSAAHGSRILVAPTQAALTIALDDGTSTQVTLDGSFVALAIAALVASFTNPTDTILLNQISNFDSIQTYSTQENLQLGGSNILFFNDLGEGVYEIMEDVTTDPSSADTLNINQMTQKQYVTKDIRSTLNAAIIGQVFPTATAGIALIEDILTTRLKTLVSLGIMGQYQDANGNPRAITPADIYVVRDIADPTLFHIGYNYFLATVAKRIFGLFTVSLPGGFPQ